MNWIKAKKFVIGMVIGIILFYISVITYKVFFDEPECYQVIFDSKGGSQVAGQNVRYGELVMAPIESVREGYTFEGWYLDGKKYDFNNALKKDITLIAKWKKIETEEDKLDDNKEEEKNEENKETEEPKDNNEQKVEQNTDNKKEETPNIGGGMTDNSNKPKPENNKPVTPPKPSQPTTPTVVEVTSVVLNKNSLTLKVGESNTLVATVKPDNASDKKVTWSSSNNGVVTVNNGVVKAVGSGSAVITATAGGKKVSCTINVLKNVTYTHEIVDIPSSSIGQCYIYIKSSEGKRVSGVVSIKYINGQSETVNVSVDGVMKVKSAIASVSVVSAG